MELRLLVQECSSVRGRLRRISSQVELVQRIEVHWRHNLQDIHAWLYANVGRTPADWHMETAWCGWAADEGYLVHWVVIRDPAAACAFVLTWS